MGIMSCTSHRYNMQKSEVRAATERLITAINGPAPQTLPRGTVDTHHHSPHTPPQFGQRHKPEHTLRTAPVHPAPFLSVMIFAAVRNFLRPVNLFRHNQPTNLMRQH